MPTPTDNAKRLHALAGKRCPVCLALAPKRVPQTLYFDGKHLLCGRGHSYSNADAAEQELAAEAGGVSCDRQTLD